jgi:hypothetical protein
MAVLFSLLTLATTVPAAAAGGPRVTNSQYGFTFVLPAGWHQVSLDPSSMGDLLGPHAKVSSSLHQALASEAAAQKTKGVIAFALASRLDQGGSFPNLNVSLQKGITPTTRQLEAGLKVGLAQAGATSISAKVVRYRYGAAVVGTYAQSDAQSSTGRIYGVQIYIAHGSRLLIMTLTSANQGAVDQAGTTVSSTLHFT